MKSLTKINIYLVLISVLFAGCAQKRSSHYPQANYKPTKIIKTVEIISDPQGARIELDGSYIGQTPTTVNISTSTGRFGRSLVIKAFPVMNGQYVQNKYYVPGQGIPNRVFFDMNLVPQSRNNININVR